MHRYKRAYFIILLVVQSSVFLNISDANALIEGIEYTKNNEFISLYEFYLAKREEPTWYNSGQNELKEKEKEKQKKEKKEEEEKKEELDKELKEKSEKKNLKEEVSTKKKGSTWYIGKQEEISDEEREKRKKEDPLEYARMKNYKRIPINTGTYISFRYLYGATSLSFSEVRAKQHKSVHSKYSGGGAAIGIAFKAPIITTRMELEYLHRRVKGAIGEEDIKDTKMLVPATIAGSIRTILFNIYMDFSFVPYIVPYISTGVGTSSVKLDLETTRLTIYPSDRFTKTTPTFQTSVGVYAKLYSFIYLDAAVRYTRMGEVRSEEEWSYVYSMQDNTVEGLFTIRFMF